jgi:phosphatidylserine/phosphatidylglycerophosphate/cardiolipin synthase-like enzyme
LIVIYTMKRMIFIRYLLPLLLLAAVPGTVESAGWWKLYFTSPGKMAFLSNRTNPEKGLVTIIGKAEKYFYGAFYEVSSPRVVEALAAARKRGVVVKLVMENDTMCKKKGKGVRAMKMLTDAGIETATDPPRRRGLMHNKFAVIDDRYLWTGSYNATVNDAEKNNNNAILIESGALADIYKKEFMEMFDDGIYGNRREPGPFSDLMSRYYVKIEDTDINAYFSPEDNIERIILKRLKKAKSSIHFMAFSFTSAAIGDMMIRKSKEGVAVYGIFEKKGSKTGHCQYTKMKLEGLAVKLDHNRNLLHHKVIVIDGERVIMGSFNFSRNANRSNDENILIIDNREIAAEYLAEFKLLSQ